MTAFWGIASRNLAEVDRRFRGAYCLQRRPDNNGSHAEVD
jgi:hypothetical protein